MRRRLIAVLAGFLVACAVADLKAQLFRPLDFLETGELAENGEGEGEDEIETDRDSFTPATTTAGRGRIIYEGAYSFIDNRTVAETHSFPELLVRVGVGEHVELRVGWNYEVGGAGNPTTGNIPSDFPEENAIETDARVLYGLKARMTEQRAWLPESAVIVQGFTPTAGESTSTEMNATYIFGWILPNEWAWDSAIRYSTARNEEDNFDVWAPSTVLKVPVGRRWKAHAEYFGIFSDNREDDTVQHFFSPGAHVLLTPNLEFGARCGWGLNQEAPNFFSNAGLGWRY